MKIYEVPVGIKYPNNHRIEWDKRKCQICGHKLSVHNHLEICFCHPEHEDYAPYIRILPKATSYFNLERYLVIVQYNGAYYDDE